MNRAIDSKGLDSSQELYQLGLNHQRLYELENRYGSSFYLLNMNKLRENYRKIEHAFKSRYANFIIGYSYKTNYVPYLCKELSRLGAYAEVVSRLEYDLAIRIGENPKRIIFNGPLKTREDIDYALTKESIVNLDSMYEIEYVKDFALRNPNKLIQIGLRINFDISENGMSILQDGYKTSRFGICTENGSFQLAMSELQQVNNIKVVGLHGHFSTTNRSVESYRYKTQKLCRIANEYIKDDLQYIDIGGGIYGEVPKIFQIQAPSFDDYADAVCKVMNEEFAHIDDKPALILEPGVSMVANTFKFVTKVIETKKITDKSFVLVDGSAHNIKPTMHKKNLPMTIIRKDAVNQMKNHFNIVGYTCMERDYLANEVNDVEPKRGDYIIFENVGAYTIVFNPPFIKARPGIVAVDDEQTFVVRRQETFDHFFNEDLYCFLD